MDRKTCIQLRDQLNQLFRDHGIEGYQITAGNANYTSTDATFKVTVLEEGAKSRDEQLAEEMAAIDGFKMQNAKGDRIVGYKPRSPKYPWIVEKRTGGRFKYTETHLRVEGFAA